MQMVPYMPVEDTGKQDIIRKYEHREKLRRWPWLNRSLLRNWEGIDISRWYATRRSVFRVNSFNL
jgi:hypothetical protein